jgi:hypothetical protein
VGASPYVGWDASLALVPIGDVAGNDVVGIRVLTHFGSKANLCGQGSYHFVGGVIGPIPVVPLLPTDALLIAAGVMESTW